MKDKASQRYFKKNLSQTRWDFFWKTENLTLEGVLVGLDVVGKNVGFEILGANVGITLG